MNGIIGSSTYTNTRNNVTMNGVDVNTLASAIVMAMKMNQGNQFQPHESNAKDIASIAMMALNSKTKTTTNTLATISHVPVRATSTMIITNDSINSDSIISPPLSPILQQSSVQRETKHTKNDYVSIVPLQASGNQLKLFTSPKRPNNNNEKPVNALVTSSIPTLEWSFTSKGKDLLIVNNHTFKCNKTTKKKLYWRCDEVENCNIWVQTTLDGIYINMNKFEHEHFCDPDRIIVKKVISLIRERCKKELLSLATIYEQEVKKAKLTEAQLCRMPRYDQPQSSLTRLRLSLLPPLPSSLQFIIPNNYIMNIDDQRFLLQDLSNQKRFQRLLIFASDRQLDILFQSEWLFIDGTFKAAPSMFTQLICIIGCFEDQAIVSCYALLDGKHTDGYRAILRTLKDEAKRRGAVLMPKFVMTDFEGGLIKAVAAEFSSDTRQVGCFFHHCQCIYRTLSSLGLKTAYETVDNVRDLCKKLMAIALMPIDDIEDAYLEVLQEITEEKFPDTRISNLLHDLMNYYEHEWISVISMNNRISQKLIQAHPNIWKVMELLVCEEFHTYQIINQITTGRKRPPRTTKEQKRYQQQLDYLYDLYKKKAINLSELLKGLA
ncbi:unnamed protein product, partial [Rotaria sordida]